MSYFDSMAPEWTPLLEAAWAARAQAYAPYSRFQVGGLLVIPPRCLGAKEGTFNVSVSYI